MTRYLILNDLHLGVQRNAGTTQASGEALRAYAHRKHEGLLALANDGDTVIVNGDLTDAYNVPLAQAVEIYAALNEWLNSQPHSKLILCLGNHDLSRVSTTLGTVQFLGALLQSLYPDRFRLIQGAEAISDDVYAISHVPNQDIFDLELGRVPEGVKTLLLHCCYDNNFAVQSDNSLNLSREQAKGFRERGITMILGHEHQQRDLMSGFVRVAGNHFPTSVADCLGNDTKRCLVIENGEITEIETWSMDSAEDGYAEIDWQELSTPSPAKFIRVSGSAEPAQAADVVRAISTLRQRSEAFVITNAVQITAQEGLEDVVAGVEDLRSVNIVELLMEMLDEPQKAAIKKLQGATP